MSLADVAKQLDWYSEDEILNPSGYGAKVYADLVQKKIQRTLKFEKKVDVNVGILVNDPNSNETQIPIAIVCEFKSEIDIDTLNLTHKLSWNFCRSPLLIIIEPTQVRALSCFIEPEDSEPNKKKQNQLLFDKKPNQSKSHKAEILQFPIDKTHSAHQAAEHLRWVDLYSGNFIREQEKKGKFPTKQKVDFVLLKNLQFIRDELTENLKLDEDIAHDLLARLIFIQFLFQRKDSEGKSAINDDFLKKLFKDGTLSKEYKKFEEILRNKTDTYNFFKWLNNKFNGDLFPGRGEPAEREIAWQKEMAIVKGKHLNLLAQFISGEIKMDKKQPNFWKFYSFDVIPLEFISSIYEEFVTKDVGVHYTPSHIVDFILDNQNVLPWDGENWDLKILDPACGSGIFLVKAFQRLVQMWKNANPQKSLHENNYQVLTDFLENNLFGIDVNPHAVRVASFSLYLAMCDEIDPKHYLQDWQFPPMRGERIFTRDFFDELPLFEKKYDLIIGNAPWAKGSIDKSEQAQKWAKYNDWEVPYKDIGPLFLPKAVLATKANCITAMIQPVNSLLFNEKGEKFRRKLFSEFKIEEIVNISALRFSIFSDAVSPSCIVILRNAKPDGQPLKYICPKNTETVEDKIKIVIEPRDTSYIYPIEAINNPLVWTALMWGNRRDLNLIKRLSQENSLQKLMDAGILDEKKDKRRGTERGKNPTKKQEVIVGRHFLSEEKFPEEVFLFLDSILLQINQNPWTYERDSTTYTAFELPQLLLKLGWQTETKRFRAVLVKSDDGRGVLCSHSYVSVHSEDSSVIESACLSYNSKLAVYFQFLSSGQFATYRPKITVEEALSVPIPKPQQNLLEAIENFEDIDKRIYELFELKDSEKILIEDLFNFTLPDFKGNINSPGRLQTERGDESDLQAYCDIFRRVIKAGFGDDTTVFSTIFQEESEEDCSPVRMVKIDLDVFPRDENKIKPTSYNLFWERLKDLDKKVLFNQRVYKGYEPRQEGVGITVYFVKPDQKRYWLRSQAYRDADEVYSEIIQSVYKDFLHKLPNIEKEKKIA